LSQTLGQQTKVVEALVLGDNSQDGKKELANFIYWQVSVYYLVFGSQVLKKITILNEVGLRTLRFTLHNMKKRRI
jgi:hypothetical protein|tara:strand:- start:184 stop:408 length:225 start_codon:yes stop_codon:yes gene_type:complete